MNIGDIVLHKNRKAKIMFKKYGLICIQYLDDSSKNWVSTDSLSPL